MMDPRNLQRILIKKIQTSHILKNKHDRVIVFEKETGRCIAGANAPTVQNLKQFLKDHPTFQVVTPGSAQSEAIKAKKKQLTEVVYTIYLVNRRRFKRNLK